MNFKRGSQQKKISKIQLKVNYLILLKVLHISNKEKKEVHKFWHVYYGPYKITREMKNNAFELSEIDDKTRRKGTYNQKDLKKYFSRKE